MGLTKHALLRFQIWNVWNKISDLWHTNCINCKDFDDIVKFKASLVHVLSLWSGVRHHSYHQWLLATPESRWCSCSSLMRVQSTAVGQLAHSLAAGGLIGSGVDEDVLKPSTFSSRSPSSSKAGLQKTFWGKAELSPSKKEQENSNLPLWWNQYNFTYYHFFILYATSSLATNCLVTHYVSKIHSDYYVWLPSLLKSNFNSAPFFSLNSRGKYAAASGKTLISTVLTCQSVPHSVCRVLLRRLCTHTKPWMRLMSAAGKGATALQAPLTTLFLLCIVLMSSAATLKKVAKYNLFEMWGNPPQ